MIKIAISKRQRERGLLARQKFAIGIASALAQEIKERVANRGQPAVRFKGYPSTGDRLIAPGYPGAAIGPETPSGAHYFANSREFHARMGARPGAFNTSGGMWEGLTVKPVGRDGLIFFSGRSAGQTPRFFTYKSGKKKARTRKISNAQKAGTVLHNLRGNPLAPNRIETVQINKAIAFWLTDRFTDQIGAIKRGTPVKGLTRLGRQALRNVI